jgi:hypothetical protein
MEQYGFIIPGNPWDRLPLTALAQSRRRGARVHSYSAGHGEQVQHTARNSSSGGGRQLRVRRDAIQQALDAALQQLGPSLHAEPYLLIDPVIHQQCMRLRTAAASLSDAYGVRYVGRGGGAPALVTRLPVAASEQHLCTVSKPHVTKVLLPLTPPPPQEPEGKDGTYT